ncbi:MAG: HRDC domain-containing protein [Thermoanaerobaculia bacterium]
MTSSDLPTYAEQTPHLVAEADALDRLVADLAAHPADAVALDTEADSFHHYYEKACLLQLSRDGAAWLVDPLAGLDLDRLFALLSDRRLLLHGADYDLRLLSRGYGFRPREIFDTMVAAQLLGLKEIGLAALLSQRLGVTLDKSSQRADWSRRPLSPTLVAYAASDVLHLHALVASLEADLAARGRTAWHAEECARLLAQDLSPAPEDPETDWRIKGSNGLAPKERAFLRELWHAREERARALDLPPFRVLHNEALVALSRRAAAGERDLAALFPRPVPSAFAARLREAIQAAEAQPPSAWPAPRRGEPVRPEPALEKAVNALKARRDATAQRLGIDPGVLASRAALVDVARAELAARRPLPPADLVAATGLSRWKADLLAADPG